MNMSFYTAAVGAGSQQLKMDVVANNLANVNTKGYKSKNLVFSELMYRNLNDAKEVETDLKAGVGAALGQVNTNFAQAGFEETEQKLDFAILGEGFFMVQNPINQEVSYTRDGKFQLSKRGEDFYLATTEGKLVLDTKGQPIRVENSTKPENLNVGVYAFPNRNGMLSVGKNEFLPVDKNGAPYLEGNATLRQGFLEVSGVEVAGELAKVIESQRAYSYALKMVQTSDEVIGTINTLR